MSANKFTSLIKTAEEMIPNTQSSSKKLPKDLKSHGLTKNVRKQLKKKKKFS